MSRFLASLPWVAASSATLLWPLVLSAQSASSSARPALPAVEPGEVGRTVIDHGDRRTVFIELVPEAVARPARPPVAAASSEPAPAQAVAPAASEVADLPHHHLFWSISVFPGPSPVSLIEGEGPGGGPAWRVAAAADFLLLDQVLHGFSTRRASYSLFAGLGEGSAGSDPLAASLRVALPAGSWRVLSGEPGPWARDALDHLHAYLAVHGEDLARARAVRLTEQERIERELRENPPPVPDVVVRFTAPSAVQPRPAAR